jgi:hypothetical protein
MKAILKAALLAGAAWSVVPTLAFAQAAPASTVEELVVTARRREESLKGRSGRGHRDHGGTSGPDRRDGPHRHAADHAEHHGAGGPAAPTQR